MEEELQQQTEVTFTQEDVDRIVNEKMAERDEAERIQVERSQSMKRLDDAFSHANTVKADKELYTKAEQRLTDLGMDTSLADIVKHSDTRVMNKRIGAIQTVIGESVTKAIKRSMAGKTPEQATTAKVEKDNLFISTFKKEMSK
ncbi:hypothetical protein CN998_01520 [Bacillus cereus]|nr:hypothetical protein CN998_01520 [Bacillus cereus]PGU50714.1 hypothetical protein COD70_29280 [Bacillus cereus]